MGWTAAVEAAERSGPSFAEAGRRSPCPPPFPGPQPQDPPPPPRGKHSALTRRNSLLFPRRDPQPLPLPPTPRPAPQPACHEAPPLSALVSPKPLPLHMAPPLNVSPALGPRPTRRGWPRGPEGAGPTAGAPLAVGRGNSRASGDPEAAAGRVGGRRGGGGRESLWPQVAAAPAATAASSTSSAPSQGPGSGLGPGPSRSGVCGGVFAQALPR